MKYKYSKLYWFLKDFEWMSVYFSPFKLFLPKLYIGKTVVGVPYFLPRKWVEATPELAHKAVKDYIKREENHNKLNPNSARKIKPYNEVFQEKMRYSYAVPLKIGFSFCGMGWKTKWDNYRFEFNPVWSFVAFGYQIALIFIPEHDMHYWECYLTYHYDTDKTKTVQERLKEAQKKNSCTWIRYTEGGEEKTNYWKLILKRKYL